MSKNLTFFRLWDSRLKSATERLVIPTHFSSFHLHTKSKYGLYFSAYYFWAEAHLNMKLSVFKSQYKPTKGTWLLLE